MKSFRQFIIENVKDVPIPKGEADFSALQRLIRKYKQKTGQSISKSEVDRLVKLRNNPIKDAQGSFQGKFDAQSEWPSSFDDYDPTDPWFDDDPKKKTKLKNTTKIRVKGKPFGKPSGIDPNIGKPKYVPPKDVPKGETGRRAKRRTWDYEKVQRDIDRADAKRSREGTGEYKAKRVNQGDVSKRARKYTQKINRSRITSDADKLINKLRKASKLQARMDKAVSTSQKPGTLSQKTNQLLKDLRLKGKPKSTVINTNSSGQTSLFPELEKPSKTKTQGFRPNPTSPQGNTYIPKNQRVSPGQTTLDFNKKTSKKTFKDMKKDMVSSKSPVSTPIKQHGYLSGEKIKTRAASTAYQIKKLATKIPKAGIEPLTAIQGYARQRDVKNATPARAITGGLLKGRSWWTGFRQGSKLSTAAALKVTKHPAYVAGAGLVGGLTGGYLTSTGTEYAFDQLLGKRGTRTQTLTEPQKEKTKNKNKVITANPKNNKGIILPPEGKKKNKITSFALNPAKVSK